MYVAMLIRQFSTVTKLPVDVNDVVKYLRDSKISDVINFVGVNINADVLRGMHYRTKNEMILSGMGRIVFTSEIFYALSQPNANKRLGCCKELIHLLDPEGARTAKQADVSKLIERIVLPTDVVDPAEDGDHATTDRIALTQALAVLFPWASRQALMPAFQDKKVTLEEIARITDLPLEYVDTVMSPVWEEIHAALVQFKWPDKSTGTDPSGTT